MGVETQVRAFFTTDYADFLDYTEGRGWGADGADFGCLYGGLLFIFDADLNG
jgi:hypothetical protein